MLRKLSDGIWEQSSPFKTLGMNLTRRMTVVQLPTAEMVLISPIQMTAELRMELENMGPVRWIIAPNLHHHLFLPTYFSHYTHAIFMGAPGLAQKRTDLPFHEVIHDQSPVEWRGQLESVFVRGMPKLNEVALFHKQSATIIFTDLVFNMQHSDHAWMSFLLWLDGVKGKFGPSRRTLSLIKNQSAVASCIQRIIDLQPQRIIMAHGQIIEFDGTQQLQNAFQNILQRTT